MLQAPNRLLPLVVQAPLVVVACSYLMTAYQPHPDWYDSSLRIATRVAAIAIIVGWFLQRGDKKTQWPIYLGVAILGLFNPLVPVHLTKAQWQPIDVATAIALFLWLAWAIKIQVYERREEDR